MKTRSAFLASCLLACALVLAGCSTGDGSGADAPGSAKAGFPVKIESALGTATISSRPKRVVTLGWGSQDVALALGVVPVGMQDMTGNTGDDTGILPWDAPKLHGAKPTLLKYTTGEVPFEQIAALRPDVILAVDSGLTSGEYKKLSQIAPTVGYPGKPWLTSWQDQLTMVGRALGKTAQADALERSTDTLIARARKAHPEFRGKTIAFGSGTTTSAFNLYLAGDSRVQLLHELGFTVSPSLPKKAASFAVPLSLEKLDSIKADVLVSWYLSASTKKTLESSQLFQRMEPVKRGGYVPLTNPAMVYATSAVSVLSLPWMLHRYLPLLSAAAKGKS